MYFRRLLSFGTLSSLLAAGAWGQNCQPGSVERDFNIQCACVKDPNGQPCELYKRNKSMYDGKGIQWQDPGTLNKAPATARVTQPSVPQQRTPVVRRCFRPTRRSGKCCPLESGWPSGCGRSG